MHVPLCMGGVRRAPTSREKSWSDPGVRARIWSGYAWGQGWNLVQLRDSRFTALTPNFRISVRLDVGVGDDLGELFGLAADERGVFLRRRRGRLAAEGHQALLDGCLAGSPLERGIHLRDDFRRRAAGGHDAVPLRRVDLAAGFV